MIKKSISLILILVSTFLTLSQTAYANVRYTKEISTFKVGAKTIHLYSIKTTPGNIGLKSILNKKGNGLILQKRACQA